MTVSKKELEQRQRAARTHGAYALSNRGPAALSDPAMVIRLGELREAVQTKPGAIEELQELTARLGVIVDMIYEDIGRHKQANPTKDILDAPVSRRGLSWIAEYRRALSSLLELLGQVEAPIDVTDYLRGEPNDAA